MLVWATGKDGLMGQSVMKTLGLPVIGSSRKEADVTDLKALEDYYLKHKPSHIVNCTAYVQVDETEGPLKSEATAVNVLGTKNLGILSAKYNLPIVHISTDYVFDGKSSKDYKEEDLVSPVNVYGKTKLDGERELQIVNPKAVILRTASLFGPYKKGLIDSMVGLLQTKESCSFVTDQISSPTHVDDVTAAIRCLLGASGIFHFVNRGFCSRFELLAFLKDLLESNHIPIKCKELVKVVQKDFPRLAIRPVRSVLSTKKIEPFLDFKIRSWEEAVTTFFMEGWVDNE